MAACSPAAGTSCDQWSRNTCCTLDKARCVSGQCVCLSDCGDQLLVKKLEFIKRIEQEQVSAVDLQRRCAEMAELCPGPDRFIWASIWYRGRWLLSRLQPQCCPSWVIWSRLQCGPQKFEPRMFLRKVGHTTGVLHHPLPGCQSSLWGGVDLSPCHAANLHASSIRGGDAHHFVQQQQQQLFDVKTRLDCGNLASRNAGHAAGPVRGALHCSIYIEEHLVGMRR